MPLRLDVRKKLNTRTERVKFVDFHSTEPWLLAALYSGNVITYNWKEQSTLRSLEISALPIRCARFVPRKQWIVCGSDDLYIRAFSYNTLEKVKEFEAHGDYIRHLAVHPSLPLLLSASDDMTVKLWNWDESWTKVQSFESHTHYVMMCQWNPKDPHLFASASLDRSVKVWGINAPGVAAGSAVTAPHFTLLGHEKGVNCVEYSCNGDRPYLISGSDDRTVRIWDYQTRQCVTVLTGHKGNVSAAVFHPALPLILTGSEDGTLKLWHVNTYRLEDTLDFGMERLWAIATSTQSNVVALGYDKGSVVIKLGSDSPVVSMQAGKVVWVRGTEVQTAVLRMLDDLTYADGEKLPLSVKDLGTCEIFPQSVSHHPQGRLLAVCGDGEYIVYTAQALRNIAYGKCTDFVWSHDGNYAIKEESGKVAVFRNFKEQASFIPAFNVEALLGGRLLGLRGPDYTCFYDWDECRLVRRIDVAAEQVWWNASGTFVALGCGNVTYLLAHDSQAVAAAIAGGAAESEEGIEIAFELVREVNEVIRSACWVSDCFVFISANLRLQSSIAGQTETIAFLEHGMWILGYLQETNRLYLITRDFSIVTYQLSYAYVQYRVAVCNGDLQLAEEILPKVPEALLSQAARFLEHQGLKEQALRITRDPEHRFELTLALGRLEECSTIIPDSARSDDPSFIIPKWRSLGNAALEAGKLRLAVQAYQNAKEVDGLFLIAVSTGDSSLLEKVALTAADTHHYNIALTAYFLLNRTSECVDVLIESGRVPEAALFARTYCPSRVAEVVQIWREGLAERGSPVAKVLADPDADKGFFANFEIALQAEKIWQKRCQVVGLAPASQYEALKLLTNIDLIEDVRTAGQARVEALLLTAMDDEADDEDEDDEEDGEGEEEGEEETEDTEDEAEVEEILGARAPVASMGEENVQEDVLQETASASTLTEVVASTSTLPAKASTEGTSGSRSGTAALPLKEENFHNARNEDWDDKSS